MAMLIILPWFLLPQRESSADPRHRCSHFVLPKEKWTESTEDGLQGTGCSGKTAAGRGARAARKAGAPMPKEMWTESTEDGLQGTGAASRRQGGGAAGIVLMGKGGKEGYGRRP